MLVLILIFTPTRATFNRVYAVLTFLSAPTNNGPNSTTPHCAPAQMKRFNERMSRSVYLICSLVMDNGPEKIVYHLIWFPAASLTTLTKVGTGDHGRSSVVGVVGELMIRYLGRVAGCGGSSISGGGCVMAKTKRMEGRSLLCECVLQCCSAQCFGRVEISLVYRPARIGERLEVSCPV